MAEDPQERVDDFRKKEKPMLKLISWNIDSLNEALTSASPRAQLSSDVLDTLK